MNTMHVVAKFTFVLCTVLYETTLATAVTDQCSTDVRCCITEFLFLITASNGFDLSEEKVNQTCMTAKDSFICLDEHDRICKDKNPVLVEGIHHAHSTIAELCTVDSPLYLGVVEQSCLQHSSSSALKTCIEGQPKAKGDPGSLHVECCEYKSLRECTRLTSKDYCVASVAQSVQKLVVDVNGLGYEQICGEHFEHCGSASLTFSIWLLVVSFLMH